MKICRFDNDRLGVVEGDRVLDVTGALDVLPKVSWPLPAGTLDTADSLARKMSGLTRGPDLFYILNNLYPGDPVTPGQKYKIVAIQ